jgi:hypothetical protein
MDLVNEVRIENTQKNNEDTWSSCCFTLSVPATKYFIQVGILIGMVVVSITMLIYDQRCESQKYWSGLLSMSIGLALPAPKLS